jgi:hypothetical protein
MKWLKLSMRPWVSIIDNSTGTGTRTGSATMVDIGGGRGELLLEVQAMYTRSGNVPNFRNLPTMKWLKLSMRPWVSIIEYVCHWLRYNG